MSKQIQQVIEGEFEAQGQPSLRKFAEWLMEDLSKDGDGIISHPTIIKWRKHGTPPATDFLEDLIAVYPVNDRRFLFALQLLAIKSPHVWGEGGVVWSLKKYPLPMAE